MGDPETEVVLPRLNNDLVELLIATAAGTLDQTTIEIDQRAATTVMLVSGGYPEAYEKGKAITGIQQVKDSIVFHAGTTTNKQQVVTNGGRVMAITSYGKDFKFMRKWRCGIMALWHYGPFATTPQRQHYTPI